MPRPITGLTAKWAAAPFLKSPKPVVPRAAAVICLGTCSAYGGLAAAAPNPGGYKGVADALGISTINLPGCPTNPMNLLGTIVKYLDQEAMELDDYGPPHVCLWRERPRQLPQAPPL